MYASEFQFDSRFSGENIPINEISLKKKFQLLKLVFSMPRIYMVQYFADLLNKADISYLQHSGFAEAEQVVNGHTEIFKAIQDHERECLDYITPNYKFGKGFNGIVMEKISDIGSRLDGEISTNILLEIESEIQATLLLLQKRIFMNRAMWFENGYQKQLGTLYVIQDEFMLKENLVKR